MCKITYSAGGVHHLPDTAQNGYAYARGFGMVRMQTYTKHGGLGQRFNLATVFNFSNGGNYRLDMKAMKQSGQFHVYQQSFTVSLPLPTTNPPPCDDCEPPKLPDGVAKPTPQPATVTSSTRP